MNLDKEYEDLILNVSVRAALSSYNFIGKKDKINADKAAVDSMRTELNKIDMKGKVVIGEGELDEAPMLYIGEKVGTLNGPKFDIAVDPLEGTKFTANGESNAFSVLAISESGGLLSAPDTYMEKIVIGSNLPKNLMDIDNGVKKNIKILADAKNGLKGTIVRFPSISVGATENALLAAFKAKGRTILKNCAIEPEINDLIKFLKKL